MVSLNKLNFSSISNVPKYKQVANYFISNILKGTIKKGEQLPSVSCLSKEFNVSRDTIEKAYRVLKEKELIYTISGKGTFVKNQEVRKKVETFFSFHKNEAIDMNLFNLFINEIENRYYTNLEISNHDTHVSINLVEKI
ncbi:GntR family transcriptional regulator [Wenyingzhuangia sp. IMCC45467]